tara:strand:- start:72 stop:434 length:363 start_codon:yes stop_codon:yes gene_type:complete
MAKIPGPFCNVCRKFVTPGEEYTSYGHGTFAMAWHERCRPNDFLQIEGIELETKVACPTIFTISQIMIIDRIKSEWLQLDVVKVPVFNRLQFIDNLIKKGVERTEGEEKLYQDLKSNDFI